MTRVAVLGAGIQGCCAALELAARGARVEVFEREPSPLRRASRWNEGKLHLGYVYANDPSLATAHRLIAGSLAFSPFLERHLGHRLPEEHTSPPFLYGVHRASLLTGDEVRDYFRAVDELVREAALLPQHGYPGSRRLAPVRPARVEEHFDSRLVQAAFHAPERSVDPHYVADALSARLLEEPRVEFHGGCEVAAPRRTAAGGFEIRLGDGSLHGAFDHLVNCTWEGRLALDAHLGWRPAKPWLHRYKLGVHGRLSGLDAEAPCATLVLGPFGDVVRFSGGRLYLSWYPACLAGASRELQPPDLGRLGPAERSAIAARTLESLAAILPALRPCRYDAEPAVDGGFIFAWGESDITDATSGLHQRWDVGVTSDRGYHSVDTGKYGQAPLNAIAVAQRILAAA